MTPIPEEEIKQQITVSDEMVETGSARKSLPNASTAIDYRLQRCPNDASHPITVLAKHRVREGAETDFEAWFKEITTFQSHNYTGYLGSEVIRPMNCEFKNEYISIFRYDTYENLSRWMHSKDREVRMEIVHKYLETPLLVTYHSLEHWFVHPADADDDGPSVISKQQKRQGPPPNYKMVVVVFLVIWFQIHFILPVTIGKIGGLSPLGGEGIGTLLVVTLTTYVFMPVATRLLSFWLFPEKSYVATLKELIPRPLLQAFDRSGDSGVTKVSVPILEEEESEEDTNGLSAV
jgi:antibiotic biosynthesis monooxygenase (ABM) superfamily enzyme